MKRAFYRTIEVCTTHNRFLRIMAAGLLLRLLIMPFFAHVDFLSESSRIFRAIVSENPFAYSSRMALSLIETVWMWICLPWLPEGGEIFLLDDPLRATAGLSDYFLFVSDPGVYRTLFLLKVPYLAFDMATACLMYGWMENQGRKWVALGFWLFNPITLYVFYLFGRYESIPLFFIALTVFLTSRQKWGWAGLAFGIGLLCREVNIFYVPIFALSLVSFPITSRKAFQTILPPVVIALAVFLLPQVLKYLAVIQPPALEQMKTESEFAHALFGMRYGWLLPFFFSYALVCLWLIETPQKTWVHFTQACCLVMIGFLLFVAHSAHYVSWMILFPILLLEAGRDTLKPMVLFCLAWMVFWAFRTDAGVFTLFLASPLSMNFFGWKTLPQLYAQQMGPGSLINLDMLILIARNVYGACLVYLGWKALYRGRHVPN
jgi:hypothetical protein